MATAATNQPERTYPTSYQTDFQVNFQVNLTRDWVGRYLNELTSKQ